MSGSVVPAMFPAIVGMFQSRNSLLKTELNLHGLFIAVATKSWNFGGSIRLVGMHFRFKVHLCSFA